MEDIEKARAIREFVLRSDEHVEWGSTVFQDVEHQCWHLRGRGWRATVSTLWDVMHAHARERPVDPDHRFELSQQSILEVFAGEADDRILGMSYGTEPSEDLLFAFEGDACQEVFRHLLAGARVDHERRSRKSTIVYSTAFAA